MAILLNLEVEDNIIYCLLTCPIILAGTLLELAGIDILVKRGGIPGIVCDSPKNI